MKSIGILQCDRLWRINASRGLKYSIRLGAPLINATKTLPSQLRSTPHLCYRMQLSRTTHERIHTLLTYTYTYQMPRMRSDEESNSYKMNTYVWYVTNMYTARALLCKTSKHIYYTILYPNYRNPETNFLSSFGSVRVLL